jgi:hypothetical protein
VIKRGPLLLDIRDLLNNYLLLLAHSPFRPASLLFLCRSSRVVAVVAVVELTAASVLAGRHKPLHELLD